MLTKYDYRKVEGVKMIEKMIVYGAEKIVVSFLNGAEVECIVE